MYTFHPIRNSLYFNLIETVFLALFGAIYENFSHGVYSYYMIYAFAIPLIIGVIPYTQIILRGKYVGSGFLILWNSAIATLSIGCVFKGILDIYGTTNKLLIVYPVAGIILILAAISSIFILNYRVLKDIQA